MLNLYLYSQKWKKKQPTPNIIKFLTQRHLLSIKQTNKHKPLLYSGYTTELFSA